MGKQPYRLAHVVSHPIQYFAPLYRAIAARPEVDLTVYFCSDVTLREFHDAEFGRLIAWDSDLVSGYEWRVVPSARGRSLARVRRRPQFDLFQALVSGRYDGIWVHGYAHPAAWVAAMAATATRSTLFIRDEQTLIHTRPPLKRLAKRLLLGLLFSRAVGLYIGVENRRYFRHYGIAERRLFAVPYAVENDALRERAAQLAPDRPFLRARVGVTDEAPLILFVGKLVEKKQPLLLLEAFERVRAQAACWLLIVGDGPLACEIDRQVEARRIPNVLRTGFINQSALPDVYVGADIFVLPSSRHETWGLVVNEALNFSLPVVVTDAVGCAADLVEDGASGFVVPSGAVDALSRRLADLVESAELRRQLGARGREIVDRYTIERCADGIVAACLSEIGRSA